MCYLKYRVFIVLYACAIFNLSAGYILDQAVREESTTDQKFWNKLARDDLKLALETKLNTNHARNVILFVGDGMGPNTVTATRIYKEKEEGYLSFEKFPHMGMLKTYSSDYQVPDSACTATALFSGVKVNYETAGVDASVALSDCERSLLEETRLKSLTVMAQEAGMSTGFVTTMRVSHATPSAMYAYSANRRWECESSMPATASKCKDISRQLFEDEPGKNMNVIMGGGRQTLVENVVDTPGDPIDTWGCRRKDGKNLINDWEEDKKARNFTYAAIENNAQLKNFKGDTDYLLGIFANGHLKYDYERDPSDGGMPSLEEMTETALKVLQRNKKGYFLMVEGGNIDMAHHRGKAKIAITEAAAMDKAVKKAVEMTDSEDTLIVVTSDHSHTLSINGYGKRGADIFGIASASKMDQKPYTTLTYSAGGPDSYQYEVTKNEKDEYVVDRRDPTKDDLTDFDYAQQVAILTDENIHGGSDVTVYAKGPYAHLFHNIHEQHYVTHVISYSAGLGDFKEFRPSAGTAIHLSVILYSITTVLIYFRNIIG